MMPLTEHDVQLLATLARYYVLTRDQLQRSCFPDHASGRTTRKRLSKFQHAGYVRKHRVPVAIPGTCNAAPVYSFTKQQPNCSHHGSRMRTISLSTRGSRASIG
jgi:hypothetical protein